MTSHYIMYKWIIGLVSYNEVIHAKIKGSLDTDKTCIRAQIMDDGIILSTLFPHYWPFVQGIHQLLVDSQHKGPVMQGWYSLCCYPIYNHLHAELLWRDTNMYHHFISFFPTKQVQVFITLPEMTIPSIQAIQGGCNRGSAPHFRQRIPIDFIVSKAVHSTGLHRLGQLRVMWNYSS